MTAASIVLFPEFDWNPAIHEQCEARAHRSGQKDAVNAYYFKGTKTIDDDIISLINSKKNMIDKATGSETVIEVKTNIVKDLLKSRYNFDADEVGVPIEE